LIDDDVELCSLMSAFFAQHGFSILAEHDGTRGLARAFEHRFDLVVLDVMMPGLDGFEVLRQLRRRSSVPVVMLTARTAQVDRIAGLNAGADDYLPKPFGPDELLARIRAVLRRAGQLPARKPDVLEVSGIRLHSGTREVWRGEKEVSLTSVEFDILDMLMRSAGRVVSRDELAAILYQREASPYERSLDVHVSHLRKKLEHKDRGLIRTIRGVGYMFCI
jgi:two-component system response regulator CpxR